MPSVVQFKSGTGTTGTCTITLTSSTTAGNCLVVCVEASVSFATPVVSTITLGGAAGNFAQAAGSTEGAFPDIGCEIWTDQNCAGGQTSVVITTTSSTTIAATVYEVSNVLTSAAVDKTVTNTSTSTSTTFTSTATATTTSATEIWFGAVGAQTNGTFTGPSSPWTNATAGTTDVCVSGYQVVSSTGTVTYSGTISGDTNSSGWVAVAVALKGTASSGPSGTVQPRATVPVPRRKRGRAAIVPGAVATTNPSGPTGTVQSGAALPAPRRKPARAWIKFTPVVNTGIISGPAGKVQPETAVPAPRRKPARAWLRFTPVTTANASGVSGKVQPSATVPTPRRKRLRAISVGNAVPGIRSVAPAQQCYTPPRRRRARAWIKFTPVPGGNGGRQLLIALAAQAGTDDYGNTFPEGIFATAGVIEGPEIIAFGAGGLYLAYSPVPAVNNMISSVAGASGTDQFGNAILAGTTSYTFDGSQYTALNMQGGVLTWYQAASEAGPWVQQSAITFQGSDVASAATVNINSGATRLVGSASAVIPTSNPGITSLPHDNNSGSTWVSGERAFMNSNWVDTVNANFSAIITILRNTGIIG